MARSTGLGRGLDSLIPVRFDPDEDASLRAGGGVAMVPVTEIRANPEQPRTEFDEEELRDLAASIREHGVLQPLLVSSEALIDGSIGYTLIAGERRLRAAEMAGLETVPVVVRESSPRELLELALIENVQRADLTALEEAQAYRRLIDDFGLTQQAVADRVGRSRAVVGNRLRLLELPAEIVGAVTRGEISEGHARALLALEGPAARLEAWQRVVHGGLNVRQTERLVRRMLRPPGSRRGETEMDPELEAVANSLREQLGTKVLLRRSKRGRGTLTIHFYSDEELDGVLERLLPSGIA